MAATPKRTLALALLCGAGLLVPAAPVSADGWDVGIGFGIGGGHRHRSHRHRRHHHDDGVAAGVGFLAGLVVGAVIEDATRPRRVVYAPPPTVVVVPAPAYRVAGPAPVPYGPPPLAPHALPAAPAPAAFAAPGACACCCRVWVPPCTSWRERVVTEPAVHEDRCVPVFEDVEVPIYEEVRVPVHEERVDAETGVVSRVQVGDRLERRQVGMRLDRVRVGERVERVLVRPETTRTVREPVSVPGHWVTVCETRGHRHDGEVLTREQYEAVVTVQADAR